jgi:hypothetical protein
MDVMIELVLTNTDRGSYLILLPIQDVSPAKYPPPLAYFPLYLNYLLTLVPLYLRGKTVGGLAVWFRLVSRMQAASSKGAFENWSDLVGVDGI